MKKLLYLLPFVLIGLNFVSFPLYKDKVDFGTSLDSLSPSYSFWKLKDLSLSFSADLNLDSSSSQASQSQPQHLYQGAKFYGFPFGAYLTSGSSTNTSSSSSSSSISAYSLLWAPVDALFVLVALIFSFKINRGPKKAHPADSQLPQPGGSVSPTMPPANAVSPSVPPESPVVVPQIPAADQSVNSNGSVVSIPQVIAPQAQPSDSSQSPPNPPQPPA